MKNISIFICLLLIVGSWHNVQAVDHHGEMQVRATIEYEGELAEGVVFKYFSDGVNDPVDQPVILVEGFDPLNNRNWDDLYNIANRERMLEDARAGGKDFFIVNFANGGDYVQRNAMLLIEVIHRVNLLKSSDREIIVIGASMGGLVSRYALCYMEANDIPHHTSLLLTLDSPHDGANIPLSIQAAIKHLHDEVGGLSDDAKKGWKQLQTPAARQMLVYHRTSLERRDGEDYVEPVETQERRQLLNELDALGRYPDQLKRVAIANGSGTGIPQTFRGREKILKMKSDIVDMRLSAVDENEDGEPAKIAYVDVVYPFSNMALWVQGTKGYDSAPGGTRNTARELVQKLSDYDPNVRNIEEDHCFIPTASALGLGKRGQNLFTNIHEEQLVQSSKCPFDTAYYPIGGNEEHVEINAQNKCEIFYELFPVVNAVPVRIHEERELHLNRVYPGKVVERDENLLITASSQVILTPGFHAKTGSKVHAVIDPNRPDCRN